MIKVGQPEIRTQQRIKSLFRDLLGYTDLGSWELRANNSNVEEAYLRKYLLRRGVRKELAERAIAELKKTAGDQARAASTTPTRRSTGCCATACR